MLLASLTSPLFTAILLLFLPPSLSHLLTLCICLSVFSTNPCSTSHWQTHYHICRHFKHAPFQRDSWKRALEKAWISHQSAFFLSTFHDLAHVRFCFPSTHANIFIPLSCSFSAAARLTLILVALFLLLPFLAHLSPSFYSSNVSSTHSQSKRNLQ